MVPERRPRARPKDYLPALDGLRALAVVFVALYHFDVGWARGGFLGVDVFFVLSGYLITGQLVTRWVIGSRPSLREFWWARARRLLPTLGVVLAASTLAMVVADRGQLDAYRGDLAAASTYTSNWWYVLHQRSYFVATGRPPVLQHLWSLAVEEQFYLVWPLVIGAVLLAAKSVAARRRALLVIAGGLALASSLAMGVGSALDNAPDAADPSRWYFGTDSHAMGLLCGAVLALLRYGDGLGATRDPAAVDAEPALDAARSADRPAGRLVGRVVDRVAGRWSLLGPNRDQPVSTATTLVGVTAFAVLLYALLHTDAFSTSLYRWGFAAVAVLTTVVLAVASRPGPLSRVLGIPLLRRIGKRSYAIYLWHWPVACFTRPGLDLQLPGWAVLVLRVALTLALTEASYRLVELPVRRLGWRRAWASLAQRRVGLVRVGSVVTVAVASLVVATLVPAGATGERPSWLDARRTATGPGIAPTPGQVIRTHAGEPPGRRAGLAKTPTDTGPTARRTGSASGGSAHQPGRHQPSQHWKDGTGTSHPAGNASGTHAMHLAVYGDSVVVGAMPALKTEFASVADHAQLGEQAWTLLPRLIAAAKSGKLDGDVVLLHTGDNGVIPEDELRTALGDLSHALRVVLVSPRVPREWMQHNRDLLASVAPDFPNVVLMDWEVDASSHPNYFYDDGIHLASAGMAAYAHLVAAAARQHLAPPAH